MIFSDLLVLNLQMLTISICGILIAPHIIAILISFELFLLSISLNFIVFSLYHNDIMGQEIALLLLSVIGAESAIGLAILLRFYWHTDDTRICIIDNLASV